MRSAAWHALLPSLVPAKPGIFFLRSRPGRFLSHAHGLRPCGAASSLPPGEYLPPLFSVAPMMDWTDNHYRTLARLISRHAWLYTEMLVAETIVHQKDKLFVGDAMSAIAANCDVPVSVKCRIGVDDRDSYEELCTFVDKVVSKSPTRHFIIHARKALLSGLSPAENRKVPPLKYEYYYALLRDFPEVHFTLNGGLVTMGTSHSNCVAAILRSWYLYDHIEHPWNMLGHVDSEIYGMPTPCSSRRQILESYQVYGDSIIGQYGISRPNVRQLVKPLLHLFHSEPGNSLWKRKADSTLRHCKTLVQFLEETLDAIPDSVLDAPVLMEPSREQDYFAHVDSLLPPRYTKLANGSYESPALVTASS
ncbi:unnamed protein product [Triticum turgidum subsp. durum]|uniref:DUS-like FMN-binding domain-containing protein n=1 Tax=Triticum turgidum subsp. durum TaxID=4567 RepID=A0A9R1NU63_TRITD|nr:unnamed protein product [Triticum turgidum subsp. durum]